MFVEETAGAEGSGVYMYRNLFNREGETQPINYTGGEKESRLNVDVDTTKMANSRILNVRRRLGQIAQLAVNYIRVGDHPWLSTCTDQCG